MQQKRITVPEYERDLPPAFNPVKYDPAAWVAMAKAAGMKYITITSKHHDGFAMYDSKVSDYDIVERTPYGKDVLKLLADECRKEGIKLFFYHSQLDWHHPDYFPRGRTGRFAGRDEKGDWNRYLDYMDAQLKELLTDYGEVGGIWFDGWWDKPEAEWRLAQTYKLIHDLQPAALVGSNHHRKPFPGEDFQMFEKDLPGAQHGRLQRQGRDRHLPFEMCDTINNCWGYNKNDGSYKITKQIVQLLVKAAGYDANLLLNVGPRPDGTIQPEFVKRLAEVGDWLKAKGETIYGTRGGPITPRPWGVTTQKGDRVFVHVLDWKDAVLSLPQPAKAGEVGRALRQPRKPVALHRRQGRAAAAARPDGPRPDRHDRGARARQVTRRGAAGPAGRSARGARRCSRSPPAAEAAASSRRRVPSPAARPDPRPGLERGRAAARRRRVAGRLIGAAVFSSRLGQRAGLRRGRRPPLQLPDRRVGDEVGPDPEDAGRLRLLGRRRASSPSRSRTGMRVKGHALVWHGATPKWVDVALAAGAADRRRGPHPTRWRGHYRGRVLRLGRRQRGDRRQQAGAAQHGLLARARARLHGRGVPPGAPGRPARPQLIYNDYGGRGPEPQVERRLRLVKDLKQRGPRRRRRACRCTSRPRASRRWRTSRPTSSASPTSACR